MHQKIIFIRPSVFCNHEWERLYSHGNVEAINLLLLSSFLKSRIKNIETVYIDLLLEDINFTNNNIDEFKKNFMHILENKEIENYDCFAIQCYSSPQYKQTMLISKMLANQFPNNSIIVGGRHPSSNPKDFLMKNSPIDFVVLGEAEVVLKEFFENEKEKKKGIKGRKPHLLTNNKLLEVEKLPSIPDYDLFFESYPSMSLWRAFLFISRCCPHQCSYCGYNLKYRVLSFKLFKERFSKLLQVIDKTPRIGNHISFGDTSIADNPNIDRIMNYLLKNKIYEHYSFGAFSRIDIKPYLFKMYHKCNIRVGYGIENINTETLLAMNKTKNPTKYKNSTTEILSKYRDNPEAQCRINILVGFPSENLQKAKETFNFIRPYAECDNIEIQTNIVRAYPGSPLYNNRTYYKKTFGTIIIPEWWKGDNHIKESCLQRISFDYSLKDAIYVYKDLYREIYEIQEKYNPKDLMKYFYDFYTEWEEELEEIEN
ncbi:MAG: cobalamin-dependent protein [Candidatus Lokiarchaeota archaeon]|nr:cobalamin-dependent protein [Candidatus Lokiarchaeota archaeon]